ncbi:MAG: RNA polymerase sigma factor [Planctomycetes bacterium]|nr:RNA polymerase sigma factor [Planctomycetota bacterium]
MRAVQGGDIAAFETLVDRHKGVVFGLAFSMLRSREDAEEAAQDTFVKVFRSRDRFDASRSFEPWLLRIAGNTSRDLLRRRRVDTQPKARSVEEERLAHWIVDPQSAGREWSEATRQIVRQEIELLSDRLRLPLVLKYVNGLTNQQVADALGISLSNVKIRMGRAKDVLQSRLEKLMERS